MSPHLSHLHCTQCSCRGSGSVVQLLWVKRFPLCFEPNSTAVRSFQGWRCAFFWFEKLQEVEGRWQTLKRPNCIGLLKPVETIVAEPITNHNLRFSQYTFLTLPSCMLLLWNSPPASIASYMKIMNREKSPNGLKLLNPWRTRLNSLKHVQVVLQDWCYSSSVIS